MTRSGLRDYGDTPAHAMSSLTRMARLVAPGLPHHVTRRGNRAETIVFEPRADPLPSLLGRGPVGRRKTPVFRTGYGAGWGVVRFKVGRGPQRRWHETQANYCSRAL
jgi:hypothetical protein